MTGDPDKAKFVTKDIENFWQAFDSDSDANLAFQRFYFDKASTGLQEFIKLRIESLGQLVSTITAHHDFYTSIHQTTLRVKDFERDTRASFHKLKTVLPEAQFPDTYFVIGRMNSGGTLSDKGVFTGTEIFCKTPNVIIDTLSDWNKEILQPMDVLPHIVAHELVHFQQWLLANGGPEKMPDTLLEQSIIEGAADFVGELISGKHINEHIYCYGYRHEQRLWQDFQQVMHGSELKDWLYGGQSGKGPSDLGYFIGYRIIEKYYAAMGDKSQAIKTILTVKDFDQFLKDSSYRGE
jgi:hypothetical protein